MKTFDAVIVGAGIVGSACALEAARAELKVCVVEPHIIGGGATAAGMGHVVAMDDSEEEFALTRLSRQLWNDIAPELPEDGEFEKCGTIWVAADEEEMNAVRAKKKFYDDRSVRTEVLDSRSLAEAEPNLRPALAGGLLVLDDSVIYPPCAAKYFIERAAQLGAELKLGVGAVSIDPRSATLTNGETINARFVVNATGSWAPELTPGIRVQKRKGHLVITDRYPGFVRHQLVELGYLKSAHTFTTESVAFNAQPRRTGQVLIGSSRQFGVEHSAVDAHMVRRMLTRASEFMPAISELNAIRAWAGFRAATPDKLPLIGPCENGLFLAAGHEGLGITTSLATARLLVDQLLDREPAIPVEPYLPTRDTGEFAHA